MNEQVERYRGNVVWIELVTGDTIERGVIERAIVRSAALVMDVRGERGDYSVALQRAADGEYRGTWEQDRGAKRGPVRGRWEALDDGGARLYGSWSEGTVLWACVLEPVEAFQS